MRCMCECCVWGSTVRGSALVAPQCRPARLSTHSNFAATATVACYFIAAAVCLLASKDLQQTWLVFCLVFKFANNWKCDAFNLTLIQMRTAARRWMDS